MSLIWGSLVLTATPGGRYHSHHFTGEETEAQSLSILTEVTKPGLPDIRALPTVLDPVKLELFIRDGCGMWPLGVCESQTAGSGLRNESSAKQRERKNGSGDNDHCQSLCECVVWEWGHKGLQSHIEETCGCSLSPFAHRPLPSLPQIFSDMASFLLIFASSDKGCPVILSWWERYSCTSGDEETAPPQ